MDGLECKEVLLSNALVETDYFRLEAEYYNAFSVSYSELIKGKDIAINAQYGTSKYCDEIKEGYPVLRLNELQNGFIGVAKKYCHIMSESEYNALRLKKGDVLIIRTNGNPDLVGQAAIVLEDTEMAFASYLYRINTNKSLINPETLVAYLNCKYGRYEIDKNSIKGNQTNFSPAKFRDINIPKFGYDLNSVIKTNINHAYALRENANSMFMTAQTVMMSALGLDSFDNIQSNYTIKMFSDSFDLSGRIDAEYFQPKYEIIEKLIKKGEYKTLKDISEIESGEFVSEKHYGNAGVAYIRGTDITTSIVDNKNATKINVNLSDYKCLNENDLAFVMIGSVGNVAENLNETAIVSNNLGVIKLKNKSLSHYVLLYLLSDIGQAFFDKYATRTAQPKIKKEDVGDFLIPILPEKDIECISNYLAESFTLRKKSKELLEYAKQAVEIAIEQSEEKAIAWLYEKEK